MESQLTHRKKKTTLRLIKDGIPVPHRQVWIEQTKHEFLFGCGAFQAINLTPAKTESEISSYKKVRSEEECDFYRKRMEMWLELFNYGTLPFYWGRYEPEEGRDIAHQVMEAAQWLRQRGVTLKGHPLCWHTNCAEWLLKYSNEEILQKQKDRIVKETKRFRGIIDKWDVINEVVIMPDFDRYDNAITRICREYGRVKTVKTMFESACAGNPQAQLLINDFNTSSRYERLIADCLDAGIPISAIGIQSHQHQGAWGAEKLYDVLERFSRFDLPIHFTENTFVSGNLMPKHIVDLNDYVVDSWPSTEEGLQRQCENIEEFYRILFSWPQVEAITTWAFQDGAWLHAPAGMVTEDNEKKPSFYTLKHLIKEEWWTKGKFCSDDAGCIAFDGFKGEYVAVIDGVSVPFILNSNSNEIILSVKH